MLTRATFRNFKNLADLSVDLGAFTVLVGPNAAGKTSVLQGIHLLTQLGVRQEGEQTHRSGRVGAVFSGRWNPRSAVTWGARELRLAVEERDEAGKEPRTAIALGCELPAEDGPDAGAQFTLQLPGQPAQPLSSIANPLNILNGPQLRRLARAALVQLDAGRMAAPSPMQDEEQRLAPDGSGLPAVISFLASFHQELYDQINATTRAVIPGFKRALAKPQAVTRLVRRPFAVGNQAVDVPVEEKVMAQALFIQMESGAVVPADMASEGTLLTLALMTLLHLPSAPSLLLIDDLDHGLHLSAQVAMIDAIRRVMAVRPELQVVCTTHSPVLLDSFDIQEVRVMALDAQGYTRIKPLSAHPKLDGWRAGMSTGELWANLGEDWVVDG